MHSCASQQYLRCDVRCVVMAAVHPANLWEKGNMVGQWGGLLAVVIQSPRGLLHITLFKGVGSALFEQWGCL